MNSSAVIFGAGSVGRGFLGQLFSESGFDVVFVDVDTELVDVLARRGRYRLRLAGNRETRELQIGPVRAVHASQGAQIATEVARASILATAVGARALRAIAASIATGLALRWRTGCDTPLNVIVCENLHDAPDLLRDHVREALPADLVPELSEKVGFVPAVIARMSPVPTAAQRAEDPSLIVAEPYKVLPVDREAFKGEIPEIVGMEPVSPFAAYVERKLYVHNAAHAVLGYLGYQRQHSLGYEALEDAWVRARLDEALDEAQRALVAEHGFDPQALRAHVEDLLFRFANRALADPIERLCRDPLRKLAPDDRLVGAARLAERHHIEPRGLAWGIGAALAYDNPNDARAVALQRRLSRKGLARVVEDLCGIRNRGSLSVLVRRRYFSLRAPLR
jgi:mannitol-1-phosphate 5-dehydrogenase